MNGDENERIWKQLEEIEACIKETAEENRVAHDNLLIKTDENKDTVVEWFNQQQTFCTNRMDALGSKYILSNTFWKIMGVCLLLILGAYGYTTSAIAYLIKHIGG